MGLLSDEAPNALANRPQAQVAGFLEAFKAWQLFLSQKATVQDALAKIAQSLEAELVALSRVSRDPEGDDRLSVHDVSSCRPGLVSLDRSYAMALLREHGGVSSAGSVWLMSALKMEVDPALEILHRNRDLADLAVIPLGSSSEGADFMEIHFPAKLRNRQLATLDLVAGTLSKTWKQQASRIDHDTVFNLISHSGKKRETPPLLSAENPARLSRTEYRVCLLLSCGKSVDNVREELGVTMATLRTHLKNVYAKTDATSQSELLCRLLPLGPSDRIEEKHLMSVNAW